MKFDCDFYLGTYISCLMSIQEYSKIVDKVVIQRKNKGTMKKKKKRKQPKTTASVEKKYILRSSTGIKRADREQIQKSLTCLEILWQLIKLCRE